MKFLYNLFYLLLSPTKLIATYYSIITFTKDADGISLDVGSGNGFFKRLCNNFYIHLFSGNFQSRKGVDIVFDAQIMPIKTDTVANISNFSVLEHLEFPIKFLLESYRILIPGGKLFIMVPFMYGEHDQVDYQRYTELGLRKLIESAGFRKNSIIRLGGTLTTFNNMVINKL